MVVGNSNLDDSVEIFHKEILIMVSMDLNSSAIWEKPLGFFIVLLRNFLMRKVRLLRKIPSAINDSRILTRGESRKLTNAAVNTICVKSGTSALVIG